MSVDAAGRVLGVSRSTVWRMIRRGELPTIRQGRRRLVLPKALRTEAIRSRTDAVRPLMKDNPIFRLVGAGRSGGKLPGARDKHAILDQ